MFLQLRSKHKEYFSITLKTFAVLGIDPLAQNKGVIISHPLSCYGHYILTLMFVLASVDYCFKIFDNMNELTLVISLLNQLIISLWKIVIFWGKRRKICRLIRRIWQENEMATDEEFRIMESILRRYVLLSRLYCMAVSTAGVIGLFRNPSVKLLQLLQGVEGGVLEVPHKASFWWDTSTPWGYTAAYMWNLITISFLFNASIAMDTLFLWFVANILIRFSLLKERFKRAAQQLLPNIRHNLLVEHIQYHRHILNLAHELDAIFAEIIFIKSLVSCTQICFLVFRIMGRDISVLSQCYSFVFLTAVVMQLLFYCYSGQLIREKSLMVSTFIFECFNWSQLPNNCQKMLQMIMLRSQKSSNLTGIFFNLNLKLYLWFFKTAGSLIAVLKTLDA